MNAHTLYTQNHTQLYNTYMHPYTRTHTRTRVQEVLTIAQVFRAKIKPVAPALVFQVEKYDLHDCKVGLGGGV